MRGFVQLGELHSLFSQAHALLDGLKAAGARPPEFCAEAVAAMEFVAMALSAKLRRTAIEKLRILVVRQKNLNKHQVIRAECKFANLMNSMGAGVLGD